MDHRKVQSKEVIRQQLAFSRRVLGSQTDSFIEEIDIVSKVRRSIGNNPMLWTAGAFLGAFLLARIVLPHKKQPIILNSSHQPGVSPAASKPSRLRSLLSLGVSLAAPCLKSWAKNTAKDQFLVLKDKVFPSDTTHH